MNLTYEGNIGLIHLVARKVFARTNAMNIGVEYEDLFQELSIVFLNAVEKFNPELGFTISAYFTRSAYTFADKLVSKERRWAIDIKAESLTGGVDESGEHRQELADTSASQELKVEVYQALSSFYTNMSDDAKAVIKLVGQSPQMLEKEVQMAIDKSEYAIEIGAKERLATAPSKLRIALSLISKVRNISTREEREIWSELEPLSDYIG